MSFDKPGILIGFDELDLKMKRLDRKVQRRVMRDAMKMGLTVIRKGIKGAIRQPKGRGRSKRRLKAQIGSAVVKDSKDNLIAKAGIKVGVKSGSKQAKAGRHGILIALGTKPRTRKKIGGKFNYLERNWTPNRRTGRMPADDFVDRGYQKSQAQAMQKMQDALKTKIEKEANKRN